MLVAGYWLLVAGYWLAATGSQASWSTKDAKGLEHERREMGERRERLAGDAGGRIGCERRWRTAQ